MDCHLIKYIGIDPGKSGGLTVIDEEGNIKAFKCPDKVIEMSSLFDIAVGTTAPVNVKFLMERVWARPTNGSRHAFTYGVNYGQWLGISAYADVHGCPKGIEVRERKNWLKDKAKELYPELKKVTLATADSVLIAHYAKYSNYFKEEK